MNTVNLTQKVGYCPGFRKHGSGGEHRLAACGDLNARSVQLALAPMTERTTLSVGAKAPAFTLENQRGEKVRLSSFKGRKVLVYFYPKADTPGCTTQACGLRDVADEIGDAVVLGVSPDLPVKLDKFDSKYSLGFTLLSDPEHATIEAYGAWGERSLYGRKFMGVIRSAVLLDEKGIITHVWPKISPKDTPIKLLKALAE